jgi:hypothetical protein
MSKHLEQIIARHFPLQAQVYPNRDKARAAMLEYAAEEVADLADGLLAKASREIAYWQNRALQTEARVLELELPLHTPDFNRPVTKHKYLGDQRFQVILFPWTKNLAIH